MKRLVISIILTLAVYSLSAQYASDALRYSRIFYGGSARFQGLGGSFGAVGADFSVSATNPAGLGLYKSAEISFSPSLQFNNSLSDYNGISNVDNKANMGMGELGMVFTMPSKSGDKGGFRNFTVAFGVNRQNDFNGKTFMEGFNNKSSLLTTFTNELNAPPKNERISPDFIGDTYPFDIGLAYDPDNWNLIFFDPSDTTFKYDFGQASPEHRSVYQSKLVTTRGSINEFDLSFAANYEDKLYLGATIGIPVIRYYETTEYWEMRNDTSIHTFRSLTYDQTLETHGTGINLKVGAIYRPANWVRLGVTVHTPTYYGNMRDTWNSQMISRLDTSGISFTRIKESPLGAYDYQMSTPFRAIGSVAFIIGTYGLVSGEYEYVNYNQARFYNNGSGNTDPSDVFNTTNKEIKTSYTSPVNVRAGTEWRIRNFRIRGGFSFNGSPYKTGNKTGERYTISGGAGYRGKYFFCDLAYVWAQTKNDYYFYDSSLVDPSQNTYTENSVVATFGVRF